MDRLTSPQFRVLGSAETPETAVDILFRHHYPSLLRTAYALLGTREGAEDAVQDAFVSLPSVCSGTTCRSTSERSRTRERMPDRQRLRTAERT